MDLEHSIQWSNEQIKEFKKNGIQGENLNFMITYNKFLSELFRWRLMFSELTNEIDLAESCTFHKDYLIELFESELKEWELRESDNS